MIIVMIIKVIHIHLKLENVKKAIFYRKNAKFLRCKYWQIVVSASQTNNNKKSGYIIPI